MDPAANRNDLAEAKRTARAEAATRRAALGRSARAEAAGRLVRHGLEFLGLAGVTTIAAYVAFRDELDPLPLITELAAKGAIIALPCVVAKGEPLVFRRWQPHDRLEPGAHGIAAPGAAAPVILPGVVLAPLLAFDSRGHRLGYGGGYYDRTLAALRQAGQVIVVGLAFDEQEMPTVPHGARDQRLDWVLTSSGARQFGT